MIPTTIATILTDVLAKCETAFAQPGAPTVPTRAYITHGLTPVWEGEQLTVTAGAINATHPFPLSQVRGIKTSLVPGLLVTVECIRACWPQPHASAASKSVVDPTKYSAAAVALANDASALYGYLSAQIAAGTLTPSLPTINTATDFAIGQMVPVGPNGTLAGWRVPIQVKLSVAGP